HIQQVIDHQSRARQESRPVPQVLLSNRVRSPAHRISSNRLPITEIDNYQQPDDPRRQRHNVADSDQPQRQQNRQRRPRPVSGRTQCIQPKRRNPLSRSNPLPLVLGRSEWPPKQNINESHIPSHPATITKPETSAKPTTPVERLLDPRRPERGQAKSEANGSAQSNDPTLPCLAVAWAFCSNGNGSRTRSANASGDLVLL